MLKEQEMASYMSPRRSGGLMIRGLVRSGGVWGFFVHPCEFILQLYVATVL